MYGVAAERSSPMLASSRPVTNVLNELHHVTGVEDGGQKADDLAEEHEDEAAR